MLRHHSSQRTSSSKSSMMNSKIRCQKEKINTHGKVCDEGQLLRVAENSRSVASGGETDRVKPDTREGTGVVKSLGGPRSLTSLGHIHPIALRSFVVLQVYENWILVTMKKKKKEQVLKKQQQRWPESIKAQQNRLAKAPKRF